MKWMKGESGVEGEGEKNRMQRADRRMTKKN